MFGQGSFFRPSVSQPASNAQRHEPEAVVTLAPVDSQPQPDSTSHGGAQTGQGQGVRARRSKTGAVDTSCFSVEQRLVAAVWVHERRHTHTSLGQIKRQFVERFGRPPPASNSLRGWQRKLFAAGAVHDAPRPGRPARRKLLLDSVRASLRAAPGLSVRARAAALRVPRSTLRALLAADLRARVPTVQRNPPRKPRPPPAPFAPPAPPAPAEGFT